MKVAIITSGGDAPGINHVIQEISSTECYETWGIHGGYDGIIKNKPFLIENELCKINAMSGKQIVKSGRSRNMFLQERRKEIIEKLKADKFDCLIVCGGNGSLEGAKLLSEEGINTIFIPMTVDNDIGYSEYSIGFDTALNSIIDITKQIHDTSYNMSNRIFMLEVQGGNCGMLALSAGVAGNADFIITPESKLDYAEIAKKIKLKLKETSYILIICSETSYKKDTYTAGKQGISFEIGKYIEAETGIRVRYTIPGFYSRGNRPTYRDCYISKLIGRECRKNIEKSKYNLLIGIKNESSFSMEYEEHKKDKKQLNQTLKDIAVEKNIILF